MSTKFDWDQFEEIKEPSGSFDWDQFEEVKEPVSRGRSLASAPAKGLLKGISDSLSLTPFANLGPIPRDLEERVIEENLPTQKRVPEELLERVGKLAPFVAVGPESLGLKALQAGAGALAGQASKGAGAGELGQGLAEAAGSGVPGFFKGLARKGASLMKGAAAEGVERLPSGLTKPRAVDVTSAKRALITPSRQQKVISQLDEEATKLARKSLEERAPISKQIQEGFDFEQKFQKDFGELQKAAEKHNPIIDITPVSELIEKTTAKYKGIPKLHSEAREILNEVRAFSKRPQTQLKNLLKIVRSNNQKQRKIFETARTTGKQKEYSDFLRDFNKAITESFERTLPEDSAWLKGFKESNQAYARYKQATKGMEMLKSILEETPKPDSIMKVAANANKQKKLELALGKEAADEIVQIAKDLKKAREAIRKIPAKERKDWEKYLPLALFIPGYGKLAGAALLPKYIDLARRGYGWLLTTPATRRSYREALKALLSKNRASYTKAATELEKALEE